MSGAQTIHAGASLGLPAQHVAEFLPSGYFLDGVYVSGSGGPYTWVVPPGVRSVIIAGTSGGGGGGGGFQGATGGGGGGGGSGVAMKNLRRVVFPGETLTITLGAGGAGGAGGAAPTAGGTGGATKFTCSVTPYGWSLGGGSTGGSPGTSTNGGAGGNAGGAAGGHASVGAGGGSTTTGAANTVNQSSTFATNAIALEGISGQGGGSGGGATGTNAGGASYGYVNRANGGNGAASLGGGGAGGPNLQVPDATLTGMAGYGFTTGGSNAAPNAPTLSIGTHGYGWGGGGGAAHASAAGNGADGTPGWLSIMWEA